MQMARRMLSASPVPGVASDFNRLQEVGEGIGGEGFGVELRVESERLRTYMLLSESQLLCLVNYYYFTDGNTFTTTSRFGLETLIPNVLSVS